MILLLLLVHILIASEELNYNVKVKGINAGTASLKLENNKNNKSEITFSVRSNKLIDLFYKLRDDVSLVINSKDRIGKDKFYKLNSSKDKKIGWKPTIPLTSGIKKTGNWVIKNNNKFTKKELIFLHKK